MRSDFYFTCACRSKNLEMVKWILELGVLSGVKIDVFSNDYKELEELLDRCNFEIFKYILNFSYNEEPIKTKQFIKNNIRCLLPLCHCYEPDIIKFTLSYDPLTDNEITIFFQFLIDSTSHIFKRAEMIEFVYDMNLRGYFGGKIDLSKINTCKANILTKNFIKSIILSPWKLENFFPSTST